MTDTDEIAGTIAGKIMSFIHGTTLYRETAMIRGINFDHVADTVKARQKGGQVVVEIEVNDVVFHLLFRKHYLMVDREVWNIKEVTDIQRLLRYLQDKVLNQYTLVAAAGTVV